MTGHHANENERPISHLIKTPLRRCTGRQWAAFKGSSHLEMDLTPSQWKLLAPLVVRANTQKHRGRPLQDTQLVLNGVFWVLRTGARWADLPDRYPSHQTCHRRFREWLADGTLFRCFRVLFDDLRSKSESPSEGASSSGHRSPWEQGEHLWKVLADDTRSWKWRTALLLRCPLARQALGEPQSPAREREFVKATQ